MTKPNSAGAPVLGLTVPRFTGLIVGALALTLASVAPLQAQDAKDPGKDPVVATVNGTPIHQSDLTVAEEEAGQLPPMSEDAKKDYLVQFMADAILITKAAEDKKLSDDADFKRKLEFARKKLLMESLLAQVAKDASTDAAMHKVYDDAVAKLPAEQEVKASHILIRAAAGDDKASAAAEEKIKAVIARLNKGEDFAKVADEVTEDPSGKGKGGDLGYFTKEQMVPEFADAAFKMEKGQVSDPVKSQFGWHIIRVEDKRKKPAPEFDAVKSQLETYVTRKAQADLVTKLRDSAKIERLDKKDDAKPADAKPVDKK